MSVPSLLKKDASVRTLNLRFSSPFHFVMVPFYELHFLKNDVTYPKQGTPYPKLGDHFHRPFLYNFLTFI
jgi:hypothetical protein